MSLSLILQLVFIAGFIYGIRLMNSPETAVTGNLVGAVAMTGAIAVTMVEAQVLTMPVIWAGLIVGSALGVWLSVKVLMIQMPQMVALFNGFGGGASALVALVTIALGFGAGKVVELVPFTWFTSGVAVLVGGVTLSGSLVAAAKLHGKMNQRPVHLPHHNLQLFVSLGVMVLSTLGLTFSVGHPLLHAAILTVGSLYFGYVFTIRVGGADMPITISLLNSFSGVAGAIAGFALENGALLVVVGSIVGASGLILTQIMCKAMNTTLMKILLGKTTAAKKPGAAPKEAPKAAAKPEPKAEVPSASKGPAWEEAVRSAKKVVIIPGYGMALAQAQLQVKQLGDLMTSQGKEVRFGIHPVAGRMPGHMNVLLAEVDVPYDQLYELDDINAFLDDADLAIIIGANDVVNPAAIELEDTPIYGMPIIRADHAKQVLVCNYDTKPGYAGVDNSLYELDKVELLLGDAKDGIAKIVAALKGETTAPEPTAAGPQDDLAGKLGSAKKVVIIPGYGMALAQAQLQVKQLGEILQSQGKEVRYGIHPVAGRMPGHMNVLLAEVDVPYDQLYELDDINAFLEDTDVAIIVGANDVVNPSAIELEDTPIYGMPIIRADKATHVIICNYDTKPGYAGVDNSLYELDKVQMLLGDAKESLATLLEAAKGETPAASAPSASTEAPQGDSPVSLLKEAKRVAIVPGYGMALAQAQGQVKRLVEYLQGRGVRVEIAVHPVAGRMPGHMNVLMAEVDIPYELMLEMDQINDQFGDVDVAVVVGANDVINPAANTHEDTPIYGMPILNVAHARHVIIYNLDRAPGYAGVDNTLYDAPNCTFVAGDAAASLSALVDALTTASA
ncbi:MAG TPA: hypothetical protein GXZ85_01770 [Firmicutes bacterium]|jgi:NAD/NADP transhydrogenase beta subunit|nr:hypothetical protein [Bacillota bacterium]